MAETDYVAMVYLGNGRGGYTRADNPDEAVNALIHEALMQYAHTLSLPGTAAKVIVYATTKGRPVQATPVGIFEDLRGESTTAMNALANHAAPVHERREIVFPARHEAISA